MSGVTFTPEARFMEAAIEMALGCNDVEHPVGAVVVKDGEIVSRAGNESHRDPTYHAERLAIAGAQIALDSRRLRGCEMYSTLEPCTLLCAGPILVGRLAVVVYGASATDAQRYTESHPDRRWMTNDIPLQEFVSRTPKAETQIVGGFLRDECLKLFNHTPLSAEEATTPNGRKLHIINLLPVVPGLTRAYFTVGSHTYDMEAPFDSEGLLSWFPTYVAKAPSCAACDRLVFPNQQVSKGHITDSDSGYSHLSCCDTSAGYAGWFNNNCEFVSAFS